MKHEMEVFKTEKDTLKKVLQVFGKSEENFEEDVASVRKWMKHQPHFPEILETKAIENFLILNKCDIEKAKEKIDMYYTVRSRLHDIFDESNPKLPHMRELTNALYIAVHPQLTKQLYRLCFIKIHNKNLAESWQICDFLRFLTNIQEVRIREDVAFGEVYIVDCAEVTFYQQLKVTPSILHKGVNLIYKKVYNLRVKGVFLLNFPSYGERVLGLFKKMLSPKIAERIYICRDSNVLKEHFPAEMIPKDFGGEGAPLSELQSLLNAKFVEYQDLFDRLDNIRVEESFRPEKLNDDVLGYYGNFKKIDID